MTVVFTESIQGRSRLDRFFSSSKKLTKDRCREICIDNQKEAQILYESQASTMCSADLSDTTT